MPTVPLRIPQIGEGLQEARLVAVLKQPGDHVKRDEPIYQMETDKAVMDVESPYAGVLIEWLAAEDTILPIGGEVGLMEVEGEVDEAPVHGHAAPQHAAASSSPAVAAAAVGSRNAAVPPRTRAYAKEKGLSDEDLASVPASGSKLMPDDIDAFLAGSGGAKVAAGYTETAMGQKQRLLSSRMQRGSQLVVPGTETVLANWEPVEALRAAIKARGGDFQPSAFTMFAYAVARAIAHYPPFRTILVGDSTLRTYDHCNLGIAVALPGDELVIASVPDSDTLDWRTFADTCRARIDLARSGKDQADETVTVSVTNMQHAGLFDAVPVVVPPSVGTIFLGAVHNGLAQHTHEMVLQRQVHLTLTFDHRVINGTGAAHFLNAIKKNTEGIADLIQLP